MQTHRLDIIHTPWSIGATFARDKARSRGELPAPTHRGTPQDNR